MIDKKLCAVRATEHIPYNGKLYSQKDACSIMKMKSSEYFREVKSLLLRKGVISPIPCDCTDEEREAINEWNNSIVEQYMPYSSMYNSMVLWSLNGLVPDDAYNKFSKKTCAIMVDLEALMTKADVKSIVPTDTAVVGREDPYNPDDPRRPIELPSETTVLIAKERYDDLSDEQKEQLTKLNLTIKVFEGDLKTAVNTELLESETYTAEELDLVSEGRGYRKSATSDEIIKKINSIAEENNIPQLLHGDIFYSEEGERDECDIVSDFYMHSFLEYVLPRLDIDEGVKAMVLYSPNVPRHIEDLCDEIGIIGIDKYKAILDEYNHSLEMLRDEGKLPTPQEIVDAAREDRKIDLISMIEQMKVQDAVLDGVVTADEEKTIPADELQKVAEEEGLDKTAGQAVEDLSQGRLPKTVEGKEVS